MIFYVLYRNIKLFTDLALKTTRLVHVEATH